MKNNPRSGIAAFTLIELMAVIVIIVILAGLVVGGMGFVSERQAKEKAKTQIAQLEKALEDYKLDNGTYPPTTNAANPPAGNSNILFRALYWNGASTTPPGRIYLAQLDPTSNRQGWTQGTTAASTIVDPWGQHYRYRTAVNLKGEPNPDTQNPDFDLWSIGKDGKTKAGRNDSANHPENRDDIRNF